MPTPFFDALERRADFMEEIGKPRVFYVHFNKIAMQRKDPKVWSIRTSKQCLHAKSVIIDGPVVTIYKPDQKNNPRAFFRGYGYGFWIGDKLVLTDDPLRTMKSNRWTALRNLQQGPVKATKKRKKKA